jgi:hypothetical protein
MLPTVSNQTALTISQQKSLILSPEIKVPAPILTGISDLAILFPAGPSRSAEDKIRLAQLHVELLSGMPVFVVDWVLRYLRAHNPRNPWPPTVQDIVNICGSVWEQWQNAIIKFYTEGRWPAGAFGEVLLDEDARRDSKAPKLLWSWGDLGPPPGEEGSNVHESLAAAVIRKRLEQDTPRYPIIERFAWLNEEWMARIPKAAISDEMRARIAKARAEYLRKRQEDEAREERDRIRRLEKQKEAERHAHAERAMTPQQRAAAVNAELRRQANQLEGRA